MRKWEKLVCLLTYYWGIRIDIIVFIVAPYQCLSMYTIVILSVYLGICIQLVSQAYYIVIA